jgi:signal transduction histidine kinase
MAARSNRILIGSVGLVWGLVSEALYYRAGTPAYEVLLDLTIGWTYLYGGLALWASRPANRIGRLMVVVGMAWFIGNMAISDVPGLREVGTLFSGVAAAALIALILAYPSGRLETSLDRATVLILAVGFTANSAVTLLPIAQEPNVPMGQLYVNVALASFAGIVVIRRWVVAPRRRRPELLPVLIAGSIQMGVLVIFFVIQNVALPDGVEEFLAAGKTLAPAAIPVSLLVGFYRQSELRQQALLDAMPDLMIRLTHDGHVLDIRAEESVLLARRVDSMVGGRLHDVLPAGVADAILSVASAAIETGEVQTLDASFDLPEGRRAFETRISPSGADEVTAIVRDFTDQRAAQSELRQSRTRIVEATDAERRRLERDLHDGAQQRLVSLMLALRLTRSRLSGDSDAAAVAGLDEAAIELKTALGELRELARGIHPAILTEAGLGPALDSLADRSSVAASVLARPERRLSPAVEATAYFVVSEALANVAKYASATRATVTAECPGDSLRVEIADDGVGGADPSGGSGLRGLADRVAALGGSLSVVSPRGGGTRVVAEIPLGEQRPAISPAEQG